MGYRPESVVQVEEDRLKREKHLAAMLRDDTAARSRLCAGLTFAAESSVHFPGRSRIRELWPGGSPAPEAGVGGIASSAGVVTSAAVIMAAVFSVFVTLPVVELKILGVGLAAAVLIDATVVYGVLLPATLALLGDRGIRCATLSAGPACGPSGPRTRGPVSWTVR
jgi:uncharacterized membrane protein YdfJ with MMPL/SSD domain